MNIDSIQRLVFYLSTTYMQQEAYQYNEKLQLYHGLPINCSEIKTVSVYVAQNARVPKTLQWESKIPRKCINFLRRIFKIIFYFFESVVYLKTIYCKSKNTVDSKKRKCDDNKKR